MRNRLLVVAVAVAALAFVGPAQSQQRVDRSVWIQNLSDQTITHFYATNSGRTDWGADHLGQGTLPPLYGRRIDFSDGTRACKFDFRAVFRGGREIVHQNVDICMVGEWTYR